ncbi:MAG: hypothetical protein EOP81_00385 [Variovorax sp.]|nr:MAG: hypothetical protein EOP81_00385 [Variovorax sp.]
MSVFDAKGSPKERWREHISGDRAARVAPVDAAVHRCCALRQRRRLHRGVRRDPPEPRRSAERGRTSRRRDRPALGRAPPGGGLPTGDLAKAIEADLGGFDAFKDAFTMAALTRFCRGWAWLGATKDGKLAVESSGNQDSPLMAGIGSGNTPVFGLDVWEHAYYLKYQNRRPEYIAAFYNVADWVKVARRHAAARG